MAPAASPDSHLSGFPTPEHIANVRAKYSPHEAAKPVPSDQPAEPSSKVLTPTSPGRTGHRRGGTILVGGDSRSSPIVPTSPRLQEQAIPRPSHSTMPITPISGGRRALHARSQSAAFDLNPAFRLQSANPAHPVCSTPRPQQIGVPVASTYQNTASYSQPFYAFGTTTSRPPLDNSGFAALQDVSYLASDESESRAFEQFDKDMTVVLSPEPDVMIAQPPTPTMTSSANWSRPAISPGSEPSYLIDLDSAFKSLGQSDSGNSVGRRIAKGQGWTAPRHHRRTESAPDFSAGSEWRRSSMTRWTGTAMADVYEEAEEDEHVVRGGEPGSVHVLPPSFVAAPNAAESRPGETAKAAKDSETAAAEEKPPAEAERSTVSPPYGLGVSNFSSSSSSSSSSEGSKAKRAGMVNKAKTSVARARSRASQWSRRRFSRGLASRSGSEGDLGGSLPPTPRHPHDMPMPLTPSFTMASVPPSPSVASAWTMDPIPQTAVSFDDVPSLTRSSSTRTSAVCSYAAASSRPISRDDGGGGAPGQPRPISSSNSAAASLVPTRRSSLASAPSFRTAPSVAPRRLSPLVPISQAEQPPRPDEGGNAGSRGKWYKGLARFTKFWGF
jgi:hypothetical protein